MPKTRHTKPLPRPNTRQQSYSCARAEDSSKRRLLPHKVLARIFTLADCSSAILPPAPWDIRLILSLVCSEWKALVFSTETLWNKVIFAPQLANSRNLPRIKVLIDTWLSRSGNTPIRLDALADPMTGLFRSEPLNPEFFGQIFVPLLARASIVLCRLDISTLPSFLNLPPGTLSPKLESIRIITTGNPMHGAENVPITIFEGSSIPKLRSVEFSLKNRNPLDTFLPWGQLTNLMLSEPISSTTCMTLLHKTSSSLETCSLKIEFSVPTSVSRLTDPLYKVRMPKLRYISFSLVNPQNDPRMFFLLKIPALTVASITLHDKQGWSFAPFTFLFKHSKKLQHLQLRNPPYSYFLRKLYPDIDNLLAAVPSIQKLSLPLAIILANSTLSKIGEGELLPRLTEVDLDMQPDLPRFIRLLARRNVLSDEAWARPGSSKCRKWPLSPVVKVSAGAPCEKCPVDWKTAEWLIARGVVLVPRKSKQLPPWHTHPEK
ncbi:uncharacterized protein LACBIDRAFT_333179 [Laccaria bicolor S238N-H82]|uniref:Predicted protein n=1 Tax=Laccaria bicolor (strain S238N-H82 / ATCC MYA-4686) TaxID=486041 RepID=B0DV54_LACBS|nr:uncharacterized protein LACBIDRAFT_333179 [Laccaria bicolor S238N-H82]EDR01519.1 predicted protein [Laccaria bicolor S238N-H82]|eukprot:XP_001887871.1 predicted protein [Laccaria bicolor S238N-H82]